MSMNSMHLFFSKTDSQMQRESSGSEEADCSDIAADLEIDPTFLGRNTSPESNSPFLPSETTDMLLTVPLLTSSPSHHQLRKRRRAPQHLLCNLISGHCIVSSGDPEGGGGGSGFGKLNTHEEAEITDSYADGEGEQLDGCKHSRHNASASKRFQPHRHRSPLHTPSSSGNTSPAHEQEGALAGGDGRGAAVLAATDSASYLDNILHCVTSANSCGSSCGSSCQALSVSSRHSHAQRHQHHRHHHAPLRHGGETLPSDDESHASSSKKVRWIR